MIISLNFHSCLIIENKTLAQKQTNPPTKTHKNHRNTRTRVAHNTSLKYVIYCPYYANFYVSYAP